MIFSDSRGLGEMWGPWVSRKLSNLHDLIFIFAQLLLSSLFPLFLGEWGGIRLGCVSCVLYGAWKKESGLAFSRGPPRAPMSSLNSIATLSPGLVQPPFKLGKLANFYGLPKQQRQNQR